MVRMCYLTVTYIISRCNDTLGRIFKFFFNLGPFFEFPRPLYWNHSRRSASAIRRMGRWGARICHRQWLLTRWGRASSAREHTQHREFQRTDWNCTYRRDFSARPARLLRTVRPERHQRASRREKRRRSVHPTLWTNLLWRNHDTWTCRYFSVQHLHGRRWYCPIITSQIAAQPTSTVRWRRMLSSTHTQRWRCGTNMAKFIRARSTLHTERIELNWSALWHSWSWSSGQQVYQSEQ